MSDVTHGAQARRLLSNTAILAAAQAVVRVASLVAFPLLTNSVEPKTFGVYLYALQIAAAWAVLGNFQLKAPLLRELTRAKEDSGTVISQVFTLRLLVSLLVLLTVGGWCCHHFVTARERSIFGVLLLGNLILAVGATFDEALQAREAFRQSAGAAVAQGLTVSGGILIGVWLGRPIAWAVGAQLAGAIVSFGLTWGCCRRVFGQPVLRLCWSGDRVRSMLKLAVGVAVGAQIGAWYGRVDLISVERLLGATALGQYGVPYRALEVVMGGVMIVHLAMLPMLARAQAAGPEALAPRLATVLRFGLLLFAPGCTLVSCLAPQILRIFKPEYAAGAEPLRVLIWVIPLVFWGAVLHWVLFFCDRPWQPPATLALALGANLALCHWWIPSHHLLGAAAARTTAEACIVLASALCVQRQVRLPWVALLARPLAMVGVMAGVWWVAPGPWWLRAAAAVAGYVLAAVVVRPLEAREWAMLQGLRQRRNEDPVADAPESAREA